MKPGLWTRVGASAALAAALGLAAAAVVVWRAEALAQRGDFAGAARWRPAVAAYHRQWGEALQLNSPAAAEAQLLLAARLDPNDPRTAADLSTAELALGRWPQAVAVMQGQQQRAPGFDDAWRLANLFLAHQDLNGFWRETAVAARQADPSYFPSLASRALAASGNDFAQLRAVLPARSAAAASAYVAAAVAAGARAPAEAGAQWLLALPAPADAPSLAARKRALAGLLLAAWQHWPADASAVWVELATAHLAPWPAKQPAPPYLRDGRFALTAPPETRGLAPSPGDVLRAVLGWRWLQPAHVSSDPVATGDAQHPTAAELRFDGREDDDLDLAEQWFLADGGSPLHLAAWSRELETAANGLSLRLSDPQGKALGELPLPLAGAWQTAQAGFTLPGSGIETFRLTLHYHRPTGQETLAGAVLATGVRAW